LNDQYASLEGADYDVVLSYAERCLKIYSELNTEHFPEQDTRYYEALQLKGSILYTGGRGRKDEGLNLLRQVWRWNQSHPGNSYEAVFRGVAGAILEMESSKKHKDPQRE
jgi:hypothetical protein